MGDNLSGKQVEQMIEDMKSPKSGNGHFATFEEVKEKFAKIDKGVTKEERDAFGKLGTKVYCCVTKIAVYHPGVYGELMSKLFFNYYIDDDFKATREKQVGAENVKNLLSFGNYKKTMKQKITQWANSCPTLIKALAYSAKFNRDSWNNYFVGILKTIMKLEERTAEEFENVQFMYEGFVNVKRS